MTQDAQAPEPYQAPANGFRTFVVVWATQALSVFGSQLTFFVTTVWLTQTLYPLPEQQPLLAAALSSVALAFALPNILLAPFAGVAADRFDRKRIMIAADVGSGLLSVLLVCSLAAGWLTLGRLVLMMVALSALTCFHNSAFDASYAMIVPEHMLPRANGMMQTMHSLSGILSPAIAAALIALPVLARTSGWTGVLALLGRLNSGAALAVGIDAATFFIAAGALPFLAIPSPRHAPGVWAQAKRSVWADIKEGLGFLAARRGMLWLLLAFAVVNLCATPAGVLQPLFVGDNLAGDFTARGLTYEASLAVLGSVAGIGGLAGGVLMSTWDGLRRKRVYGVLASLTVSGLSVALFGMSRGVYLAAALLAVRNAMIPVANAHSQTIWQIKTPRELQGRVFAVRRVVAQFTWPLGTAMTGWFGGRSNAGTVITAFGAVMAVYILAQFANRKLVNLEDETQASPVAAQPVHGAAATPTGAGAKA